MDWHLKSERVYKSKRRSDNWSSVYILKCSVKQMIDKIHGLWSCFHFYYWWNACASHGGTPAVSPRRFFFSSFSDWKSLHKKMCHWWSMDLNMNINYWTEILNSCNAWGAIILFSSISSPQLYCLYIAFILFCKNHCFKFCW